MAKRQRAAHRGSKQKQSEWLQGAENSEQERLAGLPKVQVYNGRQYHPANRYAAGQWNKASPDWIDERLHNQIVDMLRGLDRKMAWEVIGCILYFINWGIRNYLDLWHIDGMLKTAYNKIEHAASQQGIKLPMFP